MSSSDLAGCVVLVEGADDDFGAAVARNVSARGASVVVHGADEKKLAYVVGEIAASGGKARHFVGDLVGARDKAVAAFGSIGLVVTRESRAGADSEDEIAIELIAAWRDRASPSKYR